MVKKSPGRSWKSLVAARPLTPGTEAQARLGLSCLLHWCSLQWSVCCSLLAVESAGHCSRGPPLRLSFTSLFVSSWVWDCFVDFTTFYNILQHFTWHSNLRSAGGGASQFKSSLMVTSVCLSSPEWSTLIGRELYRTEIFTWCCYASSLMP